MTSTAALALAFLEGRVLSIKTSFSEVGISNLARECGRSIEKKFTVKLSRVKRTGISPYGVPISWLEYRLPTTDYNKEGIERMIEYVRQFTSYPIVKEINLLDQIELFKQT